MHWPRLQAWVDENINVLHRHMDLKPTDRVLASHHVTVNAYNNALLQALAAETHEELVPMPLLVRKQLQPNCAPTAVTRDQLTPVEQRWIDSHKDNRIPFACKGAPVRCIRSNKAAGYTNMANGVIKRFLPEGTDAPITAVDVEFEHTPGVCTKVYRGRPFGDVPDLRYVSFNPWPLAIGIAATVHSVQGISMVERVLLDLVCFVRCLAYTALSRNTTESRIFLKQPLTVADLAVISADEYYAAVDAGEEPQAQPRQRRQNAAIDLQGELEMQIGVHAAAEVADVPLPAPAAPPFLAPPQGQPQPDDQRLPPPAPDADDAWVNLDALNFGDDDLRLLDAAAPAVLQHAANLDAPLQHAPDDSPDAPAFAQLPLPPPAPDMDLDSMHFSADDWRLLTAAMQNDKDAFV